jgi:DnaK suppressor protein
MSPIAHPPALEVHRRIRNERTDRSKDVRDDIEQSDADSQRAIELTLLQMKAEALPLIEEALSRLDAGEYGSCVDCTGTITERRLRALPFAVRCQACEERREQEQRRSRQSALRGGSLSTLSELVTS